MANSSGLPSGHAARAKCTALCFIFLLAGSEVSAMRKSTEYELNGDGALFATQAHRQARVAEVRQQLKAKLDLDASAKKLCKSSDWASEKANVEKHINTLKAHVNDVSGHIKSSNGKVTTKYGARQAKRLIKEAKALMPCVDAAESGEISGVALDPELKQLLTDGPAGAFDGEPAQPEASALSFVKRIYAEGFGTAKAAIMATELMAEYREVSHCKLGQGVLTRPLDAGFRSYPTCVNDCVNPDLNVQNFPMYKGKSLAEIEASLSECNDRKTDPILAFGSHSWHTCGRLLGTTRSCSAGAGYSACCCKTNKMNGGQNDTDKGTGCTQTCTPDGAKLQRSTKHRIAMIMEEFNGNTCNYGHSVASVHFASSIRSSMEKMYYEKAMGYTPTEDVIRQEETAGALTEVAEEHVRREESRGAFMELDYLEDEGVMDIILAVICVIALFFLCMAMPDICIFLWIFSIMTSN